MFKRLYLRLCALSVFREIAETPAIKKAKELMGRLSFDKDPDGGYLIECYADMCAAIVKETGCFSLGKYIEDALKYTPSVYAKAAAKGQVNDATEKSAKDEYETLKELAELSCDKFIYELRHFLWDLSIPQWNEYELISFDALTEFYRENGWGEFAKSRALTWQNGVLSAVDCRDIRKSDEMYGYEWQRNEVYANTRSLINGVRVNNVLLFGDSGTGKSAAVKSMINIPEFKKLRIIEADKRELDSLPGLMMSLRDVPLKFIIFIDDLSFADGDAGYSTLKVILEGGVAQRPENVAVYATSNRRQLVKRNFSDRDDMDQAETVQEKTSLADRFGIRIPYMALGRPEFMELVETLVKAEGITIASDELKKEALRWEMEHAARTPRIAVQFVSWLKGQG